MSKSYRTTADKTTRDSTKFFRWWQHKHKPKAVKTNENDSDDYTDVHYIIDADAPYMNSTNATFASNHFFKKKLILGDIAASRGPTAQPITTVIVIASIFLFITMSITAATVVFCKKKNTVFVLNKSEQEDMESDYEMDEFNNTDQEYADYRSELTQSTLTAISKVEDDREDTRRPLVSNFDNSMEDPRYLVSDMPYRTRTLCENEQKGYRRLVVSAVVENPGTLRNDDSESDDLSYRIPSKLSKHNNEYFYRLTTLQSDEDSDCENSPARKKRGTPKRAMGQVRKPCSKCAKPSDINWDNIKIVTRDGEDLMLYEPHTECDCPLKGEGHVKGYLRGQGQDRVNPENFENIPLDDIRVVDPKNKGRYRILPNLVESPFHIHSKGGAAKNIDYHSPDVIVNRNVDDVRLSLPIKSVYDSDTNPRIAGVSPGKKGVEVQRANGNDGQREKCLNHSDQTQSDENMADIQSKRRYVLYELPRQRSQGTNTGVTISTQTEDLSNQCEIISNRISDVKCLTKAPPIGTGTTKEEMASPCDSNSTPCNGNVNKSKPIGGENVAEIVIDSQMSSVQGVLSKAENKSVFPRRVSPPVGRFDDHNSIFHSVSCHSDICLSLMSPTDLTTSGRLPSATISHNEVQRSSPTNHETNGVKATQDMRSNEIYDHDAVSINNDRQESGWLDSSSKTSDIRGRSEMCKSLSSPGQVYAAENVQPVPPSIPPRRFELQFEDSFAK